MGVLRRAYKGSNLRVRVPFTIAAVTALSLASTSIAQTAARTVATTIGPGERILRFLPTKNAKDHRHPEGEISVLSSALVAKNRAAARMAVWGDRIWVYTGRGRSDRNAV